MTASGAFFAPAEHGADALMHAQIRFGRGRRGHPQRSGADEDVRHGLNDVVMLVGNIAMGHFARKGAQGAGHHVGIGRIFVFRRAYPAEHVVEVGEQKFRAVLAVVLVQKKTGQFHDLSFFLFVRERGVFHRKAPGFFMLLKQKIFLKSMLY